ncbi:MAG: HNH endonuclease [Dehalococcoidia bacterium]|nr:HNH endonuclease [Dehalococcoidia bacterium]
MPELGEIKRASELGYKGKNSWIWVACQDCGRERWTRLKWDKIIYKYCNTCSQKHSHPRTTIRERGNRGYIMVRIEPIDFFHPMAREDGRVFKHRLIMAKRLNRCLLPWEVVHHKNGIKNDNRIENLELLGGNSKHNKLLNKEIKRLQKRVQELEIMIGPAT